MSNGINVNPLNAITQVYLDQIANAKAKETQKDIERWTQEEGYQRDPDRQEKDRKTSKQTDPSKDNFTGIGNSIADIMKQNAAMKKAAAKKKVSEEKKAKRWQDDDGDGKWYEKSDVDGKISKREKEEKKKAVKEHHTKDCDDNCEPNCEHDKALGEDAKYGYDKDGNSLNPKDKKKAKKVKKESFSDWRTDLREIMTDDEEQKEIKEKNVKNKIKINPKLGEAIEEIGGEVLEAYTVTKADKKGNTPAYQAYKAGKKNVKTGKPLYKAADHLKNEEVEEFDESEKVAQGARKRAQELGAARRKREGVNRGVDKNERAGYKLSQAARSSDSSLETQRTKKKRAAGDDTSQIGHYKKRDEKQTVGKRGKPLKQAKYKLSLSQRVDHHSNKALNRRDPKQNPKHTANK